MNRSAAAGRYAVSTHLLMGFVATAIVSLAPQIVYTQNELSSLRLPNPDGRDPVFDRSRRGESIDIEFYTSTDGAVRLLAHFPADVRLINYWATWCVPCVRELPSLAQLDASYADDRLRIIAVSLDRTETQEISDFLASIDLDAFEWFIDRSRQSGQAADVVALPTSILVDRDGRELGRIFGSADWASPEAIQLIETLLGTD